MGPLVVEPCSVKTERGREAALPPLAVGDQVGDRRFSKAKKSDT